MNSGNEKSIAPPPSTTTGSSGGGTGGSTTTSSSLLNQPIVMDIGTSTTKAGFAGGSKPKIVIGTKVGRTKHVRVMPGGAFEGGGHGHGGDEGTNAGASTSNESANNNTGKGVMNMNIRKGGGKSTTSVFVGKILDDHRGAFILDYPMDKGCVLDGHWDYMEMIWNVSLSIY